MDADTRSAARWSPIIMILATITFIAAERLWLRHVIPQDFHPAATSAIITALGWCLFIWISLPFPLFPRTFPPTSLTVGMTSGSFFLAIVGLLIGIGESGCSAWMLSATSITGLIGLFWAWSIREYGVIGSRAGEVRIALAKRA